jgi:hypothetical protein
MSGPPVEGHQRIVGAQPRQPAHRSKVGERTAEVLIDVILAPVHLVKVVLAEQQERIAAEHRLSEPESTDSAGSCEHLSEDGLAFSSGTIESSYTPDRYPIRDEPSARRHRSTVQGCGIDRLKRIAFVPIVGAAIRDPVALAFGVGLCVQHGIAVPDTVSHAVPPADGASRPRRRR